jgi:beta-galactosidase
VGTKKGVKNCRAYFRTKFFAGEIKAIAYNKEGNRIASTILKTANENTVLGIYPEAYEIKKEDLAYVRLKYTDKFGILKPLAKGRIDLKVTGGKLLGFGHACPYNEEGYLNDFSNTYYGEALAIIKPESDCIVVQATSPFGEGNAEIKVGE